MTENCITTLYVVRHGETEWNQQGRAQGHLDSPLTETGRTQAQYLAEGLVGRGIQAIVSSDLGRAVDTCRPIAARLGLPFETDSGLRERSMGLMQGLTQSEFHALHPEAYAVFRDPSRDLAVPGGETHLEHQVRVVHAATGFIQRNLGQTLLIVCHGGVLDCFFYHTLGLQPCSVRPFSILNASINRFEIVNDTWKLITWGEVAHLHQIRALDEV